jgi:hypothetical protein
MSDEPNSGVKKKAEERKVTSDEDFITKSPLFVPIKVDGFEPPNRISFDCDSIGCGKGTTWFRVYDPLPLGKDATTRSHEVVDWDLKSVSYKCMKCNKSSLSVVYKDLKRDTRPIKVRAGFGVHTDSMTPPQPTTENVIIQVMKVGQYPEPSIELPDALEKNLGKDSAALYKKALICRNNGYGLASAAYMRRVVEDKTNELIEVVAKFAEAHGVEAKKVEEIRAAANSAGEYTRYEDKLKIAGAVFPESLKVGGKNPLFSLFKLVSEGIHGKSEEECVKVAEDTDAVFQYVFTNLKAETEIRKAFIEKMKELP